MASLRKIVEKKKSEKYSWPEGWMTREQAANDLGVPPRDVDDALKEAIKDGDVLKQFFPLWDSKQGRIVREPGYRIAEKAETAVAFTLPPADYDRIARALQRDSSQANYLIAKNHRSTVGRVAEVRASLGL